MSVSKAHCPNNYVNNKYLSMGITGKIEKAELRNLRQRAPMDPTVMKHIRSQVGRSLIEADNLNEPNVHPDAVHLYRHFVNNNIQVSPKVCETHEVALAINKHC